MSFISSLFKHPVVRNVWQISSQTQRISSEILLPSVVSMDQKRYAFHSKKTTKRRKTHPFWWWGRVGRRADVPYKNYLTKDNTEFVDQYIRDKFGAQSGESPLKAEQLKRQEWTYDSRRCGLIARKIGVYPMWTKSGQRLLTTALQVVDNHVIKYYSREEWEQNQRPFYNHHPLKGLAVCVVGAESTDPRNFTAIYRGMFAEAGVMPKRKLTRFFVTENARLSPGTPLLASHYRVGDFVNVWGKTIDRGFQGVIKRWGFKGGDKHRGVTKAHRRPGTIGRGRKVMGPWKGKKMPGHMGCERRMLFGLKIWRINTKYNVIWVQGPAVPGPTHGWNYIYDCKGHEKRFSTENPPPFPTFYAEDAKEPLPEDIYHKDLHAFDEPTIIFEETEAERKAAIAAARATKKAKIAKIR